MQTWTQVLCVCPENRACVMGGWFCVSDAACCSGTVYRNRMINLMLTNVKLFHRATKVVQDFGDVDAPTGSCAALMKKEHVARLRL